MKQANLVVLARAGNRTVDGQARFAPAQAGAAAQVRTFPAEWKRTTSAKLPIRTDENAPISPKTNESNTNYGIIARIHTCRHRLGHGRSGRICNEKVAQRNGSRHDGSLR